MYVTRPLSVYRKSPALLSEPPPEGPNSGILVIQDEEAMPRKCFGLCETEKLRELPIPQNKSLELYYAQGIYWMRSLHFNNVFFVPVLDQPLSSNLYYAIHPSGKDRGEALTSSDEDNLGACCFCSYGPDVPPRPLDHHNKYQQMEICLEGRTLNPMGCKFSAKSAAGYPPQFLGRNWWKLTISSSPGYDLGEAAGLDAVLRARLPNFDFPLGDKKSKPVVVGKWYCPFMFVKERTPKTLKDEMNRLMYYEMTLEQNWELIFAIENNGCSEGKTLVVDVDVQSELVLVGGREAVVDERNVGDGFLWFRSFSNLGEETSVGLSLAIVERMKWEQERVGWIVGDEKKVRVKKAEEHRGLGEWKKFGCYVLTERFVLKRMNGNLVLTHDFKHTHQVRSKWE
ncbi:uncharacterized protein LOC107428267 [Ziziphus jujuba]|uniref:Uncharacterized protein LOC107428267 n=1 Tax=Ziziphus jujuba TaxID=326968 RepID=A0A6P4AY67_ZIZJJ|nr:uncharacterized protein LOC107428267 [Ziziphus jujuba]